MPDYVHSNNNYRWSPDEILELIDLIKERPCLWNVNSIEYRDKAKKEIALNYLADKFNVTIEHVKTKIHTLRTQYTHERKKIKRRETETGQPCTPLWQYYNNLNFMFHQKTDYDGDDSQNSTIWINYNNNIEDQNNEDECDPLLTIRNRSPSPLNLTNTLPNGSSPFSTSDSQSVDFTRTKRIKISSSSSSSTIGADVNNTRIKRTSDDNNINCNRRDEYATFGDYVACELRLLKNHKRIQCTLKNAILNSVIDANVTAYKTKRECP